MSENPETSSRPRVSVIIPAYNAATTIALTLDSVLAQTLKDTEIVVVDDGSTDDTQAVLARYADRIRVLRKVNEGRPAIARNLGVRASSADYIAFVDADDCWREDKLARQVELLDRSPAVGLVYTADLTIDSTGRAISVNQCVPEARGAIYDVLRVQNVMVGSSVMVRRQAFESAGGFDESLSSVENWDLWIRIAQRWEIQYVDEPLTLYRVHPGNRSSNIDLREGNVFRVLAKHHSKGDTSPTGRRLRREAYFHVYFNVIGRGYFGHLQMNRAAPALLRAALLKPRFDVLRLLFLAVLGRRVFLSMRFLKRCVFRSEGK